VAASGQDAGCGVADDLARTEESLRYVVRAATKASAPMEIYSKHTVLFVPTDPVNGGGGVGIDMYSSLPKESVGGNFTTTFTKFVVVAYSDQPGPRALAVGDDVCGATGYTDEAAASALKLQIEGLGAFGPETTNCSEPVPVCRQQVAPGLKDQLPFLSALLGPSRSLKGNLMPLMLHGQGIHLGSRVGDALALLVRPGSIWAAERVLFVFVGDLSEGLPKNQAELCDTRTVEFATQRGIPAIAEYFDTLHQGQSTEGCPPRAAPKGFATLLAAVRVANTLNLVRRRSLVSHRTSYVPDAHVFTATERGFASIIFWDDSRSEGEILSAQTTANSLLVLGAKVGTQQNFTSEIRVVEDTTAPTVRHLRAVKRSFI